MPDKDSEFSRGGDRSDVLAATLAVPPLSEASRTVPIVFAGIADPVAAGFVESLARPGGNATGFTVYEYSISGKWLELLKEVAPRVTRAAVLRELGIAPGLAQFGAIQALAPSLGVEFTNCKGDDDKDANGRDRRSENPGKLTRRKSA